MQEWGMKCEKMEPSSREKSQNCCIVTKRIWSFFGVFVKNMKRNKLLS